MTLEPEDQLSPGQQVASHPNVRHAIQLLTAEIYKAAAEVGVSKGMIQAAIDTGNSQQEIFDESIASQINERIYDAIEKEEEIRARLLARSDRPC